ncbi:MAG: carboxypeptidase regulatory-like domain-containing protein [Acidobacteriaceae bacterium]|nr:carboxypeptidase regulatory-like domain-containing protein [Acidobacteriaceae bacterium]
MRGRLALVLSLATGLFAPPLLRGQAVGEITGTLTDPSGAVMPNVKITALETAMGLIRTTVSSAQGTYTLSQLPVGNYEVTAEAPGFKKATTTGVTLDVSQQRQLDFTLSLQSAEATVEVTAAAPLVTTTNGSLGGLVTGEQVQTLPLNGRQITNLVMLQPGLNYETDQTGWMAPEWAGNGNRGQTEVAMLDNIDTTDAEMGNVQFWNFNLDAIAEFKVLQNNYSAEYGQGAGTIVQMASKSGTNQFHGTAFEFLRNSVLDARNFFSQSVPPFQRNEFGGTFGGPIKKDKTFFFGEYAGYRQRLGEPTIMSVPTTQERQGIVTVTNANGQTQTLQVPLNPIAESILNKYPLPNDPTGPNGPRTYNVQFKQPTDSDQFSIRGDHNFSLKDYMFIRASYIDNKVQYTNPIAASENPQFSSTNFNNPRNYAISETHIFSPTLVNVFSFGLNREVTGVSVGTQAYPQDTFGDGSLSSYGPDNFFTKYVITQFIPLEKVTWTKGRHTLDIGMQFRRLRDNGFGVSTGGPNGQFQFQPGTALPYGIPIVGGGELPAGSPSPNSLISFMEGAPHAYIRATGMPGFSEPGNPAPYGVRIWHLNWWIQDDFKVNSRLTLNLGFRYEYNSVPTETGDRLNAIVDDPKFGPGNLFGQLILNPNPLYHADYRGFGPRFGLAERITNKLVFRGGFGVFTNNAPTVFPDQALVNFPLASFSSTLNPVFSDTPLSVVGVPPIMSLSGEILPPNGDTKQIPHNTPVNLAPIAAFFGGPITTNLTSVNFKNGYTMAGNVTIEEELPGNMALQASYAMNNAVGLYASSWPNAYNGALPQYTPYTDVNPGLGEFQITDNHAHSTYNALQFQLRKLSVEHGIQFQAAYTYSKTIDNSSTVWNGNNAANSGTQPNNPLCYSCEKSRSGFDFPQRFIMNFQYTVPMDKWQFLDAVPKRITGGWQVMSIISAQSGFPFTVNSPYGTEEFGTDTYVGYQPTRPFLVQNPTMNNSGGPAFFSSSVLNNTSDYFGTPTVTLASGTVVQTAPGNLGRNTFRTNAFSNFDLSIVKDTAITESKKIEFRAEFFNIFNQHAFAIPGQVLGSPSFGIATATVLPERQIQFGLRFIF